MARIAGARAARLLVPFALVWGASGQVARPVARPIMGPTTVAAPAGVVSSAASTVLLQMASHAGVIFSGQVIAVARGGGFVDVRFRIDDALRGCEPKTSYVLREWAGLWTGHPERYRVGERLLMVLTPRGPSGMSSPVGGVDGAIPLLATGTEPLADAAGVAPPDTALAAASLAVDLRWIEARAERAPSSGGVAAQLQVVPVGVVWSGPISPLPPIHTVAVPPPSLTSVLALLRGSSVRPSSEVRNARY